MATNMRFSELTTASALADSDIFALAKLDGSSESGYMSYKATLTAIAIYLNKLAVYSSDLDTNDKHIIGAINELKRLISLIPQFNIVKVQVLPTEDISDTTIYLVPSSDPQTQNAYDEFIHTDNAWEQVGSTAIDLSDYYTKAQIDGFLATKANTADVTAGLALKENKADMQNDVKEIIESCYEEKTVTGNPITVKTISGSNAKALTVTMNPIQDLHGYSNPWACGAGKNKLQNTATSATINGVIFTVNVDGTVTTNNTTSAYTEFTVNSSFSLPSGTYILNGAPENSGNTRRILLRKMGESSAIATDTGSGATFTLSEQTTLNLNITISSGQALSNYIFKPMIRLSTVTDATFAPYSNICPISGRTEASVVRTGKNLLPKKYYQYNSANLFLGLEDLDQEHQKYLTEGTYTFKIYTDLSNPVLNYAEYGGQTQYVTGNTISFTVTTPNYYRFWVNKNGVLPSNIPEFQLEKNASATDYEPYQTPETKTHQYSETIYGGTDDFVNGGATSNMALYTISNLTNVVRTQTTTSGVFRFSGNLPKASSVASSKIIGFIASKLKNATADAIYRGTADNGTVGFNGNVVYFRYDGATTVEELLSALGDCQICYELATPTTISTSAEEIILLKSNNVLSTNADDMELSYQELPDITSLTQYVQTLEARIKALEEA